MILEALVDYYHRKNQVQEGALAPPGFEEKEIPFVVVLDGEGKFIDLEDTRELDGKKLRARRFVVPQGSKRSGKNSWQIAYLLWDHPGYVFGYSEDDQDRAKKQHASFVDLVKNTFPPPIEDPGIRAVQRLLEKKDFESIKRHALWPEIAKTNGNLSFRLQGDTELVCQRLAVRKAIGWSLTSEAPDGQHCLVTGEADEIERLHSAIKGVWGSQLSGANIVSFNLDAFNSYRKTQGYNAGVGKKAAFAYTTALNSLLTKGSRQRIQVGDASTVFWADQTHPFENLLADLFDEPPKDDPAKNTEAVKTLYAAPKAGMVPLVEDPTRFYVLGLSPNASRISVRFWHAGPVSDIAGNIRQHFEDIRIVRPSFKPETPSLFRLLVSLAAQEKSDNIPPNLAGDVMKAILEGTPYPRTLLQSAVARIRAEQSQKEVTYERASLIKAVLVREAHYYKNKATEVTVALDETNSNIGYRLGRLFAVLERAQEAASPDINATIRDRFYGAASSTPVTVFPQLMKLKNHHLAKLDNRGQVVNLEKQLAQIMEAVNEFPAHLSLPDQGRFAVGYYHQRQAFFTPRKESNKEGE
jgi:CRISPR-associated protein Csd1